jgi:SprT-like family
MHAEMLAPSFPPPYAHGQLMHHKSSYNPSDQLKPPLHTIHKDFSSYQPAPSIGHYESARSKGPAPAQYPEKPVAAANLVAAVYQTPTQYEEITCNSANTCYQPSNAPPFTERSQPFFDTGHLQTSVLVVAPDIQTVPEVFALNHNGNEPYEQAGNCAPNHHCNPPEHEQILAGTTTANFSYYEHLDRDRPQAPALVVFPEPQKFPEIPILGRGGPEPYEHGGSLPSNHHHQRLEFESVPTETVAIGFEQHQRPVRSRSQTPKQAVAAETQPFSGIIVLEHNGAESYEPTTSYPPPPAHQRPPSECEKIPVETSTASFNQSQPLVRSRSHTPTAVASCDVYPERPDIAPSRQREPGPYGRGTDFASNGYQYPSPADPPAHQAQAGVNHAPVPVRGNSRPQSPTQPVLSPIRSEPVLYPPPTPGFRVITETQPDFYLLEHDPMTDEEAAASVYNHFSQHNANKEQARAEQELSRLILSSPLMTGCLGEVVHWANILFFEGKLTVAKVDLQWSDPSDPRFDPQSGGLIGTTELKPDHTGGFQTRIILSRQRLMSGTYDQRLVLSAILHECVHAYLFICRGFEAMENGGHTDGFRNIARLIDSWVDGDGSYLRLHSTEADLESFRTSAGHGWNCSRASWGQDNGFLWTSSRL